MFNCTSQLAIYTLITITLKALNDINISISITFMDPTHEACGFDLHLFNNVYGFKLWCSFRTWTLSTG